MLDGPIRKTTIRIDRVSLVEGAGRTVDLAALAIPAAACLGLDRRIDGYFLIERKLQCRQDFCEKQEASRSG